MKQKSEATRVIEKLSLFCDRREALFIFREMREKKTRLYQTVHSVTLIRDKDYSTWPKPSTASYKSY